MRERGYKKCCFSPSSERQSPQHSGLVHYVIGGFLAEGLQLQLLFALVSLLMCHFSLRLQLVDGFDGFDGLVGVGFDDSQFRVFPLVWSCWPLSPIFLLLSTRPIFFPERSTTLAWIGKSDSTTLEQWIQCHYRHISILRTLWSCTQTIF